MPQYIIKSVARWVNKAGKHCEVTSYFQKIIYLGGVALAKEMGNKEQAKRYETKGGARIDIRKYFHGAKEVTAEQIEDEPKTPPIC